MYILRHGFLLFISFISESLNHYRKYLKSHPEAGNDQAMKEEVCFLSAKISFNLFSFAVCHFWFQLLLSFFLFTLDKFRLERKKMYALKSGHIQLRPHRLNLIQWLMLK